MNLLKSRVPYLTDEAWTELVMKNRQIDEEDISIPESERIERAQIKLAVTRRMEDLGFAPPEEINMAEGRSDDVTIGEAMLIREEFRKNGKIEMTAELFGISSELIRQVIDGIIWPYAGGPLRPPLLSGLNEKSSGYTANQKRFIRGAIALAKRELSDQHFEIFCHNNGMTVPEANEIAKNVEQRNGKLSQQRYRGVLVRHSQGTDVEKCIASYRRRASKKVS